MKRRPQASSMVLTSLEDNVSDCGCTKKQKLMEASLGDLMLETTVRGAVNGAGVVGDAMRNAVRGLGDAVRACTQPLLRTTSAQPVFLLARPKPSCNTYGNQANGKTHPIWLAFEGQNIPSAKICFIL